VTERAPDSSAGQQGSRAEVAGGLSGSLPHLYPSTTCKFPRIRIVLYMRTTSCDPSLSSLQVELRSLSKGSRISLVVPSLAPQRRKVLLAPFCPSVANAKQMWRYPQVGQGDSCGGILTPAGGLLFLGMMPARWRRWKPRLADLSGISIPAKAFAPLR